MGKKKKTNAIRLLDQKKIEYEICEYDTEDGLIDGKSVAQKTGRSPERVFKTLVAQKEDGSLCVFCVPVAATLNLKKAAKAVGAKRIRMIPMKDLLKHTGYIHGGCSPVGMKKHYPTWIDEAGKGQEALCVSGGLRGIQVCLLPADLILATQAEWADLADLPVE